MLSKIKHKMTNINKQIFIRNFLFISAVTVVYSLSVNIPLINMQYPDKYFILAFAVSIFRDYIIWFIAFLNKWIFALFTFLTFISGLGLRYMNKYLNMDLSTGNFEVILATNFNEAKGIINIVLVAHLIIGLLLALICVYLRFRLSKKSHSHTNISKNGGGAWLLLIISLTLLFLGKLPENYMKTIKYGTSTNGVALTGRGFDVMPEKIYENLYHIFIDRMEMKTIIANRKNIDISDITYINKYNEEQIIIFILTDALRPDHMSLYGYNRETTPYMEKYGFIPFNDMYSCETVTSRSVPCLLTTMKRHDYYLSYFSKPSIFNIFKKAGFYTALISSQGSMGALAAGQTAMATDADYSFSNSNFEVKYDIELLPYFDKILNNIHKNKLIMLHINGSHWDYNTRFEIDDAKWKPLCDNFASCSSENFINSYDNTILATDTFVKNVIEKVKDKNAVIYFSSDHGQLLGEGGLRLHAQGRLNIKELAVVPFAVWYSDKAKKYVNIDTILNNKDKITTHDIIFHSITSCAGIKSDIIDTNLSICSDNLTESPNEFINYISKPIN